MRRILLWAVVTLASIGLGPPSANSAPIVTDTWYTFSFQGVGSPLTACIPPCTLGTNAPDGHPIVAAPDAPWTIATAGSATLRVLDGFLSVDQFDIRDFATNLGNTSVPIPGSGCGDSISCAFNNPAFSRRDYLLAPGSHSLTGTHILGPNPGAGFFEVISAVAAVPEPTSLALLGVALMGMSFISLRRRVTSSR
jgi:PEP-CTERM motif